MREDATKIFYSSNMFKIHTVESSFVWEDFEFLRALPANALPYIRSLHCIFPIFGNDDLKPGTASQINWQAT
ncbi:MAG: hypothetical protein M1830_006754, partial [Pleopsidium flavum]